MAANNRPQIKEEAIIMGDFLITMGIIATIFSGMILITSIVENFGVICRFVKAAVEVIGEYIFDAQTEFFKARQHKRGTRK